MKDYREITLKQKNKRITKKIHALEISKKIKEVKLNEYLVSSDYMCLYRSAQADTRGNWPKLESSYAFDDYMNNAVCTLFNTREWGNLNL